MRPRNVLFGVAGWSYDDWKGVVYPRGCKDTLRAVAQRVDAIEINSTFYGLPTARNSRSWVERTADLGTAFTAKLPKEFTHARQFTDDFVAGVRDGFAPLAESRRLLGLLAQFDYTFAAGPFAIEHLARLATAFEATAPLFVELRHRSWNAPEALDALRGLGVGVLALDYPGAASGFGLDVPGVNGRADVAYFRLHGRNTAWFQKGAGRDQVYDWEYSAAETRSIEGRVERLARAASRTLVVANNHYQGKAIKLVDELLRWYRDGEGPGAAP